MKVNFELIDRNSGSCTRNRQFCAHRGASAQRGRFAIHSR